MAASVFMVHRISGGWEGLYLTDPLTLTGSLRLKNMRQFGYLTGSNGCPWYLDSGIWLFVCSRHLAIYNRPGTRLIISAALPRQFRREIDDR